VKDVNTRLSTSLVYSNKRCFWKNYQPYQSISVYMHQCTLPVVHVDCFSSDTKRYLVWY